MRHALLAIAIFAIIGTAVGFLVARTPFVAVIPVESATDLDLERRALRYERVTVTDSRTRRAPRELLVLGPADRIFEPWLEIEFGLEGIELVPLVGDATRVPEGTATAVWDPVATGWHFSPERIDPERFLEVPASANRSERAGGTEPVHRSLPEGLRELAPERGALIDRAFPAGGGR